MMSLSPDECKWSESLVLRQQGLRWGFTGTGVDACQRCKCGDLRAGHACAGHSDIQEHWPPQSLQEEHTLTPDRSLAYLWMCICPASKIHPFIPSPLDSSWIPADHRAVNHNVLCLSPSHLHPSDPPPTFHRPLPCYLIATTTMPALMSLLAFMAVQRSHMLSQACIIITNTHTCRPTLTPL